MLPSNKISLFSADTALVQSVSDCLTDAGYPVVHFSGGLGAVEVSHSENPILVILDMNLPDFNSLAIIRTLRSEDHHSRVPSILIAPSVHEGDVLLGLEVGQTCAWRKLSTHRYLSPVYARSCAELHLPKFTKKPGLLFYSELVRLERDGEFVPSPGFVSTAIFPTCASSIDLAISQARFSNPTSQVNAMLLYVLITKLEGMASQ